MDDIIKLNIGADPFYWILRGADYQALAGELSQATGPVVVDVHFPLRGRLVLSRAAGSVSVVQPRGVGWNPSDATLPAFPVLYLPSVTPPTGADPGFVLAPGTDVAALERDIVAAMNAGTALTIAVSEGHFVGVAVLHGATLPYAVLCPGTPVA